MRRPIYKKVTSYASYYPTVYMKIPVDICSLDEIKEIEGKYIDEAAKTCLYDREIDLYSKRQLITIGDISMYLNEILVNEAGFIYTVPLYEDTFLEKYIDDMCSTLDEEYNKTSNIELKFPKTWNKIVEYNKKV